MCECVCVCERACVRASVCLFYFASSHGETFVSRKERKRKVKEDSEQNNIVEWTGKEDIRKEEVPGGGRSMRGHILTYSRL